MRLRCVGTFRRHRGLRFLEGQAGFKPGPDIVTQRPGHGFGQKLTDNGLLQALLQTGQNFFVFLGIRGFQTSNAVLNEPRCFPPIDPGLQLLLIFCEALAQNAGSPEALGGLFGQILQGGSLGGRRATGDIPDSERNLRIRIIAEEQARLTQEVGVGLRGQKLQHDRLDRRIG